MVSRPVPAVILFPAIAAQAPDSQCSVARFALFAEADESPVPPHSVFPTIDDVDGEAWVMYTADESAMPVEPAAPDERPRIPNTADVELQDVLQMPWELASQLLSKFTDPLFTYTPIALERPWPPEMEEPTRVA